MSVLQAGDRHGLGADHRKPIMQPYEVTIRLIEISARSLFPDSGGLDDAFPSLTICSPCKIDSLITCMIVMYTFPFSSPSSQYIYATSPFALVLQDVKAVPSVPDYFVLSEEWLIDH